MRSKAVEIGYSEDMPRETCYVNKPSAFTTAETALLTRSFSRLLANDSLLNSAFSSFSPWSYLANLLSITTSLAIFFPSFFIFSISVAQGYLVNCWRRTTALPAYSPKYFLSAQCWVARQLEAYSRTTNGRFSLRKWSKKGFGTNLDPGTSTGRSLSSSSIKDSLSEVKSGSTTTTSYYRSYPRRNWFKSFSV